MSVREPALPSKTSVKAPARLPRKWARVRVRLPETWAKALARLPRKLAREPDRPPRVRARQPRELEIRQGKQPKEPAELPGRGRGRMVRPRKEKRRTLRGGLRRPLEARPSRGRTLPVRPPTEPEAPTESARTYGALWTSRG